MKLYLDFLFYSDLLERITSSEAALDIVPSHFSDIYQRQQIIEQEILKMVCDYALIVSHTI